MNLNPLSTAFPADISISSTERQCLEKTVDYELTDDRCLSQLCELDSLLDELEITSLFLVADQPAYRLSGAETLLQNTFASRTVTVFSDFEPNPRLEQVQLGLQQFQQTTAQVVIAVGGGTAIDIAKLIAAMSRGSDDLLPIIHRQHDFVGPATPFIAVPTTTGTGSEATQFAVVYWKGRKYSVDHPRLLPRWSVLDPALTVNLPAPITACTGLDAFAQAMESLWSVNSTARSRQYAQEALQLAWTHLPTAVQAPTPAARKAMCRASHLAGRAINLTRTTAAHAISYPITSDFGVPHGHAVVLTLGAMLSYNFDVSEADLQDRRGIEHVQGVIRTILEILDCQTVIEGRHKIEEFVQSLGCETRLSQLGISGMPAFQNIAAKVNLERLGNNPRSLNTQQLLQMLESIA